MITCLLISAVLLASGCATPADGNPMSTGVAGPVGQNGTQGATGEQGVDGQSGPPSVQLDREASGTTAAPPVLPYVPPFHLEAR